MKGATFPNCPLDGCAGKAVTKISKRGNEYRQCDTCGEFLGSRYLTKEERVQWRLDEAAKKARKRKPTKAQLLAEYKAERELLNALTQLPVVGWEPGDWFPELRVEQGQMRMGI